MPEHMGVPFSSLNVLSRIDRRGTVHSDAVVQCSRPCRPRRASGYAPGSGGPLKVQLQRDQEAGGFAACHHAMVKGERQR